MELATSKTNAVDGFVYSNDYCADYPFMIK